jgi:hypothetical protein
MGLDAVYVMCFVLCRAFPENVASEDEPVKCFDGKGSKLSLVRSAVRVPYSTQSQQVEMCRIQAVLQEVVSSV